MARRWYNLYMNQNIDDYPNFADVFLTGMMFGLSVLVMITFMTSLFMPICITINDIGEAYVEIVIIPIIVLGGYRTIRRQYRYHIRKENEMRRGRK